MIFTGRLTTRWKEKMVFYLNKVKSYFLRNDNLHFLP